MTPWSTHRILPLLVSLESFFVYGNESSLKLFCLNLSFLVADLVKMADLEEDLAGETLLTLFAPVDSAFEKLPSGLVEKLTKPLWKPQLQDVSVQVHFFVLKSNTKTI